MKTNTKKNERNSCRQWHTIFLILLFWNSLLNPRKQQDCSLANKSNPTLGLAYFVAAIHSILHHWFHPVWFCSMIGWTRYARQTNKWTNGRKNNNIDGITKTELVKSVHIHNTAHKLNPCVLLRLHYSPQELFSGNYIVSRSLIHKAHMIFTIPPCTDRKLSDETNVKAICI